MLLSAGLGFPFSVIAYAVCAVTLPPPLLAIVPVAAGWACWGFLIGAFRDGAARDRERRSRPAA
jgi:hypothetical protein